jgi:D-alanyl-D-alanine carboxypeptidase/D-alanyl-D-alanine-endopeptidase (penicillin-binding protein 4)
MPSDPASLTRRALLASLAGAAAVPALAEAPGRSIRPLRRPGAGGGVDGPAVLSRADGGALEPLIAAAKLGGVTAVALVDAGTGDLVEGVDPDRALPPASCLKAVTSMFALDRLGADFRWQTQVLATGPVAGGVVQGDLVLAGSGDPTLSTDSLGDLVARLAARGITGVAGDFLVWDGALPQIDEIDGSQPAYAGYNPSIAGLNLNFNRVHFEWRRGGDGWALTMDARGERFVPAVGMATMRVADRDSPLFTYARRDGRDAWTVAAPALGKGGARWLPVRQPGLYAGEVFQALARAQGIRLPAPRLVSRAPAGSPLVALASEPLAPVLTDMLRHSTNLTAEVVGLTASGAAGLQASAGQMADWLRARHGISARFVDHSGLGPGSRIAPADLARALARSRQGPLPGLLRHYGMRNAEGAEIKGGAVRVVAKTGTLNFVSGLAGLILPPAGRPLAFAILSADTDRRDRLPPEQREEPPGGASWVKRARGMQARMVGRWGRLAV